MLVEIKNCGECPASHEVPESPLCCCVGIWFNYLHQTDLDGGIPDWCPLREGEVTHGTNT